jgi:hypothetical protein
MIFTDKEIKDEYCKFEGDGESDYPCDCDKEEKKHQLDILEATKKIIINNIK